MNQHVSLNCAFLSRFFPQKKRISPTQPWRPIKIQPPRSPGRHPVVFCQHMGFYLPAKHSTLAKPPKKRLWNKTEFFFHQVGFFCENEVLIGTRTCFDGFSWYICMMGLSLGLGVDGWGWYHISVMSNSQVLICVQIVYCFQDLPAFRPMGGVMFWMSQMGTSYIPIPDTSSETCLKNWIYTLPETNQHSPWR